MWNFWNKIIKKKKMFKMLKGVKVFLYYMHFSTDLSLPLKKYTEIISRGLTISMEFSALDFKLRFNWSETKSLL